MSEIKIQMPEPSVKEAKKWLEEWNSKEKYTMPDEVLEALFTEVYQQNNNIKEVKIKAYVLNRFYSTNVLPSFLVPLAKRIICPSLNFDERVRKGCVKLVNDLGKKKIKNQYGQERGHYIFATKYCSFHNPKDYPICDSYVRKILIHFQGKDSFSKELKEHETGEEKDLDKALDKALKDYITFYEVHKEFREHYKLGEFSLEKKHTLKEIDQYLWLAGKEYFSDS